MSVDAVYLVREGDDNEELRYSLRTLAKNVPHSGVWIVGYKPRWVSDVVAHIQTVQGPDAQANQCAALRAMSAEIPGRFDVWNDDFYALKPTTVRLQHQGPLAEHHARFAAIRPRSSYVARLLDTLDYLGPGALSYEIHRPMPVSGAALLDVLDEIDANPRRTLQWRSLYGNRRRSKGRRVADRLGWWPESEWCTTDEYTWPAIEHHMASRFPDPCIYEKEGG